MICGVDVGGKRARLCFLREREPEKPMMVRYELPSKTARATSYIDVARWATAQSPRVWATMEPDVVWIEEPRGGSQRAVHQLSVMIGALLCGLPREASVELVTAGEARKLCGLPGNLAKSGLIEWMDAETDVDFDIDEHDADAYVMARAVLAHGEREESDRVAVLGEG